MILYTKNQHPVAKIQDTTLNCTEIVYFVYTPKTPIFASFCSFPYKIEPFHLTKTRHPNDPTYLIRLVLIITGYGYFSGAWE
jgi:hypothetical protein